MEERPRGERELLSGLKLRWFQIGKREQREKLTTGYLTLVLVDWRITRTKQKKKRWEIYLERRRMKLRVRKRESWGECQQKQVHV